MPLLNFQFSAEQLKPKEAQHGVEFWEKNGHEVPMATESLLFQGRLGERMEYATNARQHGIKWLPEIEHSVVYRFADTWACICCRVPAFGCSRGYNFCGLQLYSVSFTRAQWLWAFNLICFLAHQTMAYLSFTSCNGSRAPFTQERINPNCTAAGMEVPIFRLTSTWTNRSADGYALAAIDNGMPVRFDYITGWFFQLSAIFHLFPVLLGPFDRFAFLYWEQIDMAWCWWRWCEYTASAPLMFMGLQLIVGIRDQNTLALSWVLMALTMFFGLAQESWSRPAPRDPDGYRGWVGDPPRTNEIMAIEEKRRTHRDRNFVQRPEGPVRYAYNQTIEEANSAQRYNYKNQGDGGPPPAPLEPYEKQLLRAYAMQYTRNYFYRYACSPPTALKS